LNEILIKNKEKEKEKLKENMLSNATNKTISSSNHTITSNDQTFNSNNHTISSDNIIDNNYKDSNDSDDDSYKLLSRKRIKRKTIRANKHNKHNNINKHNTLTEKATKITSTINSNIVDTKSLICTCQNSECSKNYCICYNYGLSCSDKCRCQNCKNDKIGSRTNAIIIKKNSLACNCINSGCKKNYCICRKNKQDCNKECNCDGCYNIEHEHFN